MPKRRTSSIASGGSRSSSESIGTVDTQGAGSNQEVAERLNERLVESGVVNVEVPSRTRGQIENVSVRFSDTPGIAQVGSASGNTYTVDYENGTCDCMHYRMRQQRCRHIDAANIAIGQISERNNQETEHGTAVDNLIASDAADEIERNQILVDPEDDNFFYLDNISEFENKIENNIETDYEYENVLNGNNVTFGLELEFVGGDADSIARELYELGICAYDHRVGYHHDGVDGKWKLERDGSVSAGNSGGELVSPILKDTPDTWRKIENICEVAKRHGATINDHTGGHVHIGMDQLDTARQRWRRFFKIMSGYEECIYRAAGGDIGHIRRGHSSYATPFADRANFGISTPISMNSESDVRELASRVSNDDRYYAINLTNISSYSGPNTVEFRYFNGSLNPKQIQANVKLAAGVIAAAERSRTRNVESIGLEVNDSTKRRGKLINESRVTQDRTNKKIAEFLDIIFTRKRDKDSLINVFSKNSWR